MSNSIKEAQELLYGSEGLAATNLKLFPGSRRDVTAEEIAQQIVAALRGLDTSTEAN